MTHLVHTHVCSSAGLMCVLNALVYMYARKVKRGQGQTEEQLDEDDLEQSVELSRAASDLDPVDRVPAEEVRPFCANWYDSNVLACVSSALRLDLSSALRCA